jgi:phospholipid/cholesterol/gamma-HCH transport system substrate-binding protein
MSLSRSARVGLTGLAGLVCAAALIVYLGDIHFARPGYRVTAMFNYVDSLKPSAPVLYGGGVKIGEVDALSIRDGRVAVDLNIRKDVRIPSDAEITIHTVGILGEKYVQVGAGGTSPDALQPGAVVEGADPGSLDRALQRVEALADYLEPLLKNPKIAGGVEGLLNGLGKATDHLNGMIDENRGDVRSAVTDLKALARELKRDSDSLSPAVRHAGTLLDDDNTRKIQRSLDTLDESLARLDHILAHIEDKKGAVGVLVFDDQTGDDLRDLLSDLKRHPWKLLWKK